MPHEASMEALARNTFHNESSITILTQNLILSPSSQSSNPLLNKTPIFPILSKRIPDSGDEKETTFILSFQNHAPYQSFHCL